MNCPKCGTSNTEDAKFCTSCGAAISSQSGTAPPGSAPHSQSISEFAKTIITPGLIARVKGIILTPVSEWNAIDAETTPARAIYLEYVAPLAAIGALAGFIGRSIIGYNVAFFGTVRTPLISGLVGALVIYALTLLGVFVVSLIVDALAPTFGGQKDLLRALKVSAYSYTPAWIAAVFQILPSLGLIGLIAGLYGIYLLYLGLPVLMRSPKDKAIGYTAVVCVCIIVVYLIIGAISAAVVGGGLMGPYAARTTFSDTSEGSSSGGAVSILTGLFGGRTSADQQRVATAMQTLANSGQQQSAENGSGAAGGNSGAKPVDTGAALNALGTILSGGAKIKPVDFHALKAMLPDSLPGIKRDDASGETAQAMGFAAASATAHYSDGNGKSVTVEITDLGSMSGLAGLAAKFDPNLEKETDTGYERTTHVNGQLIHQQYDNRSKDGEVEVIAGNRFSVSVKGHGVDMDVLTDTLKQFDLQKLASLGTGN